MSIRPTPPMTLGNIPEVDALDNVLLLIVQRPGPTS